MRSLRHEARAGERRVRHCGCSRSRPRWETRPQPGSIPQLSNVACLAGSPHSRRAMRGKRGLYERFSSCCGMRHLPAAGRAMPQKGTKFDGCVGRSKQNSRSTVMRLGLVYRVAFAFGPEVHLRLACKCLVLTRAWVTWRAYCVLLSLVTMIMVMARMAIIPRTERLSRRDHRRRLRRASCFSVVLLVFTY